MRRYLSRQHGLWRRHANPWSVWTRLAVVPVAAAILYLRPTLGWWTGAGMLGLVVWLWLNLRLFSPMVSDDRWEARAIFGEKLWLQRGRKGIPAHHARTIAFLNVGSTVMLLPAAYGLLTFDPWAAALGVVGMVGGQMWALDRYAWLYADLTRGLAPEERRALVDPVHRDESRSMHGSE